jgi:tetratricopeptide (TPR) repeat protein
VRAGPWLTLASSALLTASCAAERGALRADPGPPAPAWTEASSAGFDVWTDLAPEEAARVAAGLERLQATLEAAWPGPPGAPRARVRVVLLESRPELAGLAGPSVVAFFTRRTDPPTIVAAAGRALADPSLLAHELAHHLVGRRLVEPPRWLDEGLAEHLATAGAPGVPPGTVGAAPWWADGFQPEPGFVRRLLAWDGRLDRHAPRRELSEAWALVHFLANEEPRRFAGYLRALAEGMPAHRAFDAAFPEWSPQLILGPYRLETRVGAFLASGHHRTTRFAGALPRQVQVSVRPAPPAEVRLLRLELPRASRLGEAELRAEVLAALRDAPDHPEALRFLAQLDRLDPLPLAVRAVEARPRDWRSWRFLAGALGREGLWPEREAALRQAAGLAPGRPELLRALAQHLLDAGRPAEAAPLARLAAELAPWDPAAVATYAAAALEVGACPVADGPAFRAAVLRAEPALDPARRALAEGLFGQARRCELARRLLPAAAALEARASVEVEETAGAGGGEP